MPEPDLNILLVDDHPVVRRVVSKILNQLGYRRILEAGDGVAALRILAGEKIDLIVSDLNMPKIDGFELLAAVRQNPSWSAIPFIILTSEIRAESLRRAFSFQATQYIIKPFTAEEFMKKIGQLFPQAGS